MKTPQSVFSLILIFACLLPAVAQAQAPTELTGVWKKIYRKLTRPDGLTQVVRFDDPAAQELRIYNHTHYFFGLAEPGGKVKRLGEGRYQVIPRGVVEHWLEAYKSRKYENVTPTRFAYALEGDILTFNSLTPGGISLEEKYVRIE